MYDYRVRDAGPEIVHKLTICGAAPPGFQRRFYFTAYTEAGDRTDAGSVRYRRWIASGCWRQVFRHDDDLSYRGWYYGRLRVRNGYTSAVRLSSWRRFWSS